MAIPDFQSIFAPLLRLAADGQEHSSKEAGERLAEVFNLTEDERDALLPSGRQPIFTNRIAWAKVYLGRAGLLHSPRRGLFRITERGRTVLQENPQRITVKYLLDKFPEFAEFHRASKKEESETGAVVADEARQTPEETLDLAYQRLRAEMASQLLVKVKESSPKFFEQLVVEVLLAMGYGGSRKEAGAAIGKGGDEGIDGVINEDRLGLDIIYIQAKKWDGSVGRPEIQKFVGALHGRRAKKGVFLTTSSFSAEAVEYVAKIEPKVVLIEGKQLAELMIDFNVGVTPVATYEIKRVDSDYFSEE